MSINGKLEKIYDEWEHKHPCEHFVRHGVPDEETYLESKPRIVFLGREVNDFRDTEDTMVDFLRKQMGQGFRGEAFHRATKKVGLWAYGILNGFPQYDASEENYCASLGIRSIGWTNLKKSGGAGQADKSEVERFANLQFELWSKELEVMSPQFVLCGGAGRSGAKPYSIVSKLLLLQQEEPIQVHHYDFPYSIQKTNRQERLFIEFFHPGYWSQSYEYSYELLMKVFEELCERGLYHSS